MTEKIKIEHLNQEIAQREKQLNTLICTLFKLTDEEIKLIEQQV